MFVDENVNEGNKKEITRLMTTWAFLLPELGGRTG